MQQSLAQNAAGNIAALPDASRLRGRRSALARRLLGNRLVAQVLEAVELLEVAAHVLAQLAHPRVRVAELGGIGLFAAFGALDDGLVALDVGHDRLLARGVVGAPLAA